MGGRGSSSGRSAAPGSGSGMVQQEKMNAAEIRSKIKELAQKQREIDAEMEAIKGPGIGGNLLTDPAAKAAWLEKNSAWKKIEREIDALEGQLIDLEEF